MDLVHRKKVTAACGCTTCVNLKEPRYHVVHDDKIVYFCSRSCVKEFNEDPAAFLESDHFKIKFDVLDSVESRLRENLSEEEIEDIRRDRQALEEDGLLRFVDR